MLLTENLALPVSYPSWRHTTVASRFSQELVCAKVAGHVYKGKVGVGKYHMMAVVLSVPRRIAQWHDGTSPYRYPLQATRKEGTDDKAKGKQVESYAVVPRKAQPSPMWVVLLTTRVSNTSIPVMYVCAKQPMYC